MTNVVKSCFVSKLLLFSLRNFSLLSLLEIIELFWIRCFWSLGATACDMLTVEISFRLKIILNDDVIRDNSWECTIKSHLLGGQHNVLSSVNVFKNLITLTFWAYFLYAINDVEKEKEEENLSQMPMASSTIVIGSIDSSLQDKRRSIDKMSCRECV